MKKVVISILVCSFVIGGFIFILSSTPSTAPEVPPASPAVDDNIGEMYMHEESPTENRSQYVQTDPEAIKEILQNEEISIPEGATVDAIYTQHSEQIEPEEDEK